MSSLQRDAKIYGAVESESYVTFTGFCKKIYDSVQQSVDVFIDDQKVETLLANEKIADIENKYEVFDTNGFCFTYKLPKEYIGQKHKLEFKTQDGEQLLHSPTHTIDKFSPLYNQAMFIESLNQPIQYNVINDGYSKNALSFIAIEENLHDEGFVQFVLEMCKKYKELQLNIIYFNEVQKNLANKVFNQVKNKEFSNPSNIQAILQKSEIYLHNVVEEFRFTINEEYYNKVKNQTAIKENLFILELTRKAKKKKDMAEMVVDTITPILFKTSVVSEIFKDDKRYNEFVFMNSLGSVDEDKIKDVYCPNSIGFLATKENLEDEEFVEYIKELIVRFPDIEFKGFYSDEKQKELFEKIFYTTIKKVKFCICENLFNLCKKIEIYIASDRSDYLSILIGLKISSFNPNIYYIYKNSLINKEQTITDKNAIQNLHFRKIIDNKEKYSFSNKILEESNGNFTKLIWNNFYKNILNVNYEIQDEDNLYNLTYFEAIDIAFKYHKFKKYRFDFLQIHRNVK